jgi:hypothetical protein
MIERRPPESVASDSKAARIHRAVDPRAIRYLRQQHVRRLLRRPIIFSRDITVERL